MSDNQKLLLAFSPWILVAIGALVHAYFYGKRVQRLRNEWRTVFEGTYDYAVYGEYDYVRMHRTGAMVHTSRATHHVMKVTAVYFDDGRTAVMEGRQDMDFPTGTAVRIIENGLGQRKIEKMD